MPTSLMVETSRQAGLAVSHLGLGVSLDTFYLLDRFGMEWAGRAPKISLTQPFEAELDLLVQAVRYRGRRIRGLDLECHWNVDGMYIGTASATLRCFTPAQYRAIRRNAESIARPQSVPENTTQELPGSVQVKWDPYDPTIFDHPADHVPGMALIDAMLAVVPSPASLEISFPRFAELNAPVHMAIEHVDGATIFSFDQHGLLVAHGRTTSERMSRDR